MDELEETLEKEKENAPEGEKKKADVGLFYEQRLPELEPESFEEGFTVRTMLGALFVAIIMMPGAMYLSLMMGGQLGPAAEWTTIILFVEVARRSLTTLRRQEIYLIYYLAGTLMTVAGVETAISGGPFGRLIWLQYVRQSPAAKSLGIADQIPNWVAPPPGSTAYIQRTFLHHDWTMPILLLLAGAVLSRMQWIGLGYILFRTTSDVERLPFPLAPVAAQGATALAEVSQEKETWRWPVFSTGTMVGLLYGVLFVAVPVLSGAFALTPIRLIPIPFVDFTTSAEGAFPTGRIGLGTDLGTILTGFVIPFPVVVGGAIASSFTNLIFSPTLYRLGISHGHNFFPTWRPGMNLIQTEMSTSLDLWISVVIGTTLAIATIGLCSVMKKLLSNRVAAAGGKTFRSALPPGRGDFPIYLALAVWFVSTLGYVIICHALVPKFPLWIIVLFGFIWSPLISYVSARLLGLVGQGIALPFMSQAAFILSKYKGVDIWFAPVPTSEYGWAAARFREAELTGTKMTSVIKAEAFALVVVLVFSFLYWSFFWKLSAIPSAQYPQAQTIWPLDAFNQLVWATGTQEGGANYLLQAVKFPVVGAAAGGSILLYLLLSVSGMHYLWFYGLIGGLAGKGFYNVLPALCGALLGRYYMSRRFGIKNWRLYAPVLLAGYACGIGLIGMFSIAVSIIFKAVRVLPY